MKVKKESKTIKARSFTTFFSKERDIGQRSFRSREATRVNPRLSEVKREEREFERQSSKDRFSNVESQRKNVVNAFSKGASFDKGKKPKVGGFNLRI